MEDKSTNQLQDPKISIIVAMTKNRVMGIGNHLPWDISEDRKLYKNTVIHHPVIMGRKTYFSIPDKYRPLPNRTNIIISSQDFKEKHEDVFFVHSIDEAIKKAKEYNKEIFIIGGSGIYQHFLPTADFLYISHIKKDYEGDTFFPEVNWDEWEVIEEKEYEYFIFKKYKRKSSNII
jgi:dihydrofolate reductase